MVKKTYCSYELAKLMVNKGFDPDLVKGAKISHQLAMSWVKENYKLCFVISHNKEYEASIMTIEDNPRCKCRSIVKNTYEEVIDEALKYCFKKLI